MVIKMKTYPHSKELKTLDKGIEALIQKYQRRKQACIDDGYEDRAEQWDCILCDLEGLVMDDE